MKKSGGGCGKLFTFFLGVFAGIFIVIGSVVGFGFWAYNNLTIAKVEKTFNFELGLGDEELRNSAIKDLIPEVVELLNSSVGEVASTLGYTIPTEIEVVPASGTEPAKYADLSEALNIVLDGKITEISANFEEMMDMLTVGYLHEVLSEPLDIPNINLFNRYQNVKIVNIGNIIDQITVGDLLEPNLDGSNNVIPYTGVLGALSDKTLVYLMESGNMEATINGLKLKEVITISDSDTGVMGALKELKISELNNNSIISALNNKKLSDILNITATDGVMAKLKDVTIGDISAGNIDDEIKSLKLSEIIEIEETQGVLFALKDKTISELTSSTIMALKVSDIYTITDNTGIMYSIKDWKLNELTDTKFKTLKINQLLSLSDTESGILGAIANWTLNDFTEDNLQGLKLEDILDITTDQGIMGALKGLTLENLTDDNIKTSIESLKIQDIITIEGTNKVWDAIKDSSIGGLGDTLDGLTLSAFIAPNGTGVEEGKYVGLLGYLISDSKDPNISELDSAIEDAVEAYFNDVTIGELIDKGIIEQPEGYDSVELDVLRSTKLVDFINDALRK